jgi:hypothetical protein
VGGFECVVCVYILKHTHTLRTACCSPSSRCCGRTCTTGGAVGRSAWPLSATTCAPQCCSGIGPLPSLFAALLVLCTSKASKLSTCTEYLGIGPLRSLFAARAASRQALVCARSCGRCAQCSARVLPPPLSSSSTCKTHSASTRSPCSSHMLYLLLCHALLRALRCFN